MKKGDKVEWKWGASKAEGTIEKKYDKPVTKTIKGTQIKRNASKDEPAYEIKQKKGNKVIKSESELKKSESSPLERGRERPSSGRGVFLQATNMLLSHNTNGTTCKVPLLRGGAKDRVVAGVCFCKRRTCFYLMILMGRFAKFPS